MPARSCGWIEPIAPPCRRSWLSFNFDRPPCASQQRTDSSRTGRAGLGPPTNGSALPRPPGHGFGHNVPSTSALGIGRMATTGSRNPGGDTGPNESLDEGRQSLDREIDDVQSRVMSSRVRPLTAHQVAAGLTHSRRSVTAAVSLPRERRCRSSPSQERWNG